MRTLSMNNGICLIDRSFQPALHYLFLITFKLLLDKLLLFILAYTLLDVVALFGF